MKLPSWNYLIDDALRSFLRFPMVILSAFAGTFVGIYLVDVRDVAENLFPLINFTLSAALGIPLFFILHILAETGRYSKLYKPIPWFSLLAFGVLIACYFSFPDQDYTHNTTVPYVRYLMYSACFHLLVCSIPLFLGLGVNSFWNYNIMLFFRIIRALLYSIVIFSGIAMALLALHLLFDVYIDDKVYLQVFILSIGVFNTWFFISGIAKNIPQMENDDEYPKSLKVFAQYILLPLLLLYLLILYGYGTRIIIQWDWPRGIVSYLILCISFLGVLTFLLLYPYGYSDAGRWIRKTSKSFYFLLIPLLILLFLAVGIRISDYGFTVNRYLVLMQGIWLSMVCLYMVPSRGNIKFIPVSLAIMLLIASAGPWGVFSISERSQINRLETILSEANMLRGGKIKGEVIWEDDALPELESPFKGQNNGLLTDSLRREVSSIIHYLNDHHGFKLMKPWFSQDMDQVLLFVNRDKLKWQRFREARLYLETLGLDYHFSRTSPENFFIFHSDPEKSPTSVTGFDYLVEFSMNISNSKEFSISGESFLLRINEAQDGLTLVTTADTIEITLDSLIGRLIDEQMRERDKNNYLPASVIKPKLEIDDLVVGFEFHQINIDRIEEGKHQIQHVAGYMLIEIR